MSHDPVSGGRPPKNLVPLDIPIRRSAAGHGLDGLPQSARVLVIRLRSMGDTVLLTPALRLLHDWRPDLRVSVLLDRPWDDLLADNPVIDSVLTTGGKLETLWRVRRAKFGAVVNLHGGPTSAQITQVSGARLRVGLAHFRSQAAYNLIVPRAEEVFSNGLTPAAGIFHTAEHAASVMGWLGVPLRMIPRAELFPSSEAKERVRAHLAALGMDSLVNYAVIHPAALYATKQWSAAGFAGIVAHLDNRHGLRPVFLGAPSDADTISAIQQHCGSPLPRAIGWPISDMMALLAGARVFLGNDSGPAHAAAALGVPVAAIFGSSSSAIWGPWRARSSAIIQNHYDCNPCAGDRCHAFSEPRCILSITSEQVREAIDVLLANRPNGV
ncbi:MAG: glycosyltransferase family 9 protein [Acidobacteria bacterium]|nr:glycosyltransferase family 9 protein [Acidobacteriota bacterium]